MNIDIPGLKRLWQEAFGDSDTFIDGFFATGFSPERCRFLDFDGNLAAALYWFDCRLGDKKLAYIYAVATDKAYRGRGLCRKLMEAAHKDLAALGYHAAVLVPGNEKLFGMYRKLGYTAFCPMALQTVTAGQDPIPLQTLSCGEFAARRHGVLPEGGIVQEGAAIAYLATFTEFYAAGEDLMCLSREGDTVYFQEYLGDPKRIPGILCALGAKKALVRTPGDSPYAMYLSFDGTDLTAAYFGISLG